MILQNSVTISKGFYDNVRVAYICIILEEGGGKFSIPSFPSRVIYKTWHPNFACEITETRFVSNRNASLTKLSLCSFEDLSIQSEGDIRWKHVDFSPLWYPHWTCRAERHGHKQSETFRVDPAIYITKRDEFIFITKLARQPASNQTISNGWNSKESFKILPYLDELHGCYLIIFFKQNFWRPASIFGY